MQLKIYLVSFYLFPIPLPYSKKQKGKSYLSNQRNREIRTVNSCGRPTELQISIYHTTVYSDIKWSYIITFIKKFASEKVVLCSNIYVLLSKFLHRANTLHTEKNEQTNRVNNKNTDSSLATALWITLPSSFQCFLQIFDNILLSNSCFIIAFNGHKAENTA